MSESPRGPSPWDKVAVLSSSPGVEQQLAYSPDVTRMPRLSAEIEEVGLLTASYIKATLIRVCHPHRATSNTSYTYCTPRLLASTD